MNPLPEPLPNPNTNSVILASGWRKDAGMQPLPAGHGSEQVQAMAWFGAICMIAPWWVPVLIIGIPFLCMVVYHTIKEWK